VQTPVPGGTLDDGIARWRWPTPACSAGHLDRHDRLTLTAGVRLDTLSTGDKPQANAAAAAPLVAGSVSGNNVVRNTGGFGRDNSVTVDGQDCPAAFRLQLRDRLDGQQRKQCAAVRPVPGAAANVWFSILFEHRPGDARGRLRHASSRPATAAASSTLTRPSSRPSSRHAPAANVDFLDKAFRTLRWS